MSAFGFGGNNAHLVVEEHVRPATAISVPTLPDAPVAPVAIVGIGIRLGSLSSRAEVLDALVSGAPAGRVAEHVVLPLEGLAFPPRDLEAALGQHTMALACAFDAIDETSTLPRDRTAVIIGIETDPDAARLGCRWRLSELAARHASEHPWLPAAHAALGRPIDAAVTLGAMPNMPANRISRQLDLHGPSFTVSSGEDSGLDAIDLAVDALQCEEADAALVGAVDLSVHPVHELAVQALGEDNLLPAGDGAVVLVLKRLQDAEAAGDRVYATIGAAAADPRAVRIGTAAGADTLTPRFGHAFAAAGVLHLAVAALCLHHRIRMTGRPWLSASPRSAVVSTAGRWRTLAEAGGSLREPEPPGLRLSRFSADEQDELVDRLERGSTGGDGRLRAVLVSASGDELAERRRRACEHLRGGAPTGRGARISRASVGGELAFVFTAAGTAYRGMGASLLRHLPELADDHDPGFRALAGPSLDWAFDVEAHGPPTPSQFLWGSSTLARLHWRLTHEVLGLRPTAVIGCSSGETASLFAGGAWTDYAALHRDIEAAGIMDRELGGSFCVLERRWGAPALWRSVNVRADVERVRAALDREDRAHLAIINSPVQCVIAGEASAIARVVASIGANRCAEIDYRVVCHVPELEEVASAWQAIHTRDVTPTPGVRYYANAVGGAYEPSRGGTAEMLLAQALDTVDFAATIRAAYADGVRIFVEHGPQNACAGFIAETLGDRDHLVVSLDRRGTGFEAALDAIAALAAAGVEMDLERLARRVGSGRKVRSPSTVRLAARWIAPVGRDDVRATPTVPRAQRVQTPAAVQRFSELTRLHTDVVQRLAGLHSRYVLAATAGWAGGRRPGNPPDRAGPIFGRDALVTHATGRISEVFGQAFGGQDRYRRQVRMPAPPLLLVDRVMELDAEPRSMGTGRIVTETDVRGDAWYLHDGRMPAGMLIEAGQADLMLISFLGVDFINRGERVYRLLGCTLTFEDDLPRAGETLRYEITIDHHARAGDTRLFFFRNDCTVAGLPRLTVRNGSAGFFSDDDLATAGGVVWSAEDFEPCVDPRLDPPEVELIPTSFDREHLEAFAGGRPHACFGAGFEMTEAHTRSPSVPGGDRLHLARVTALDFAGGPWGRGHMAAEVDILSDDWFFAGHFVEDPVMPGNLVFETGFQAMAFFIAALGFTRSRDGWRFQPVVGEPCDLKCRGQIHPTTREVLVEVFVEEFIAGPVPTLYADVLVTADGVKSFHGRRAGLQLVPGYPSDAQPELIAEPPEPEQVARADGVAFGYAAMLAAARGRPSAAFGPSWRRFDGHRRCARLPSPPYLFVSRVTRVDRDPGQLEAGARVETAYDIPRDAWYFGSSGASTMPLAVLLETALQPCGWLACYVGFPLNTDTDLAFRNLDGVGTMHAEVRPGDGVVRTSAQLTNVSRSGNIILVSFDVHCRVDDRLVYEMAAGFGFFPDEALAARGGITEGDRRHFLARASDRSVSVADDVGSGSPLVAGRLRMLDRITGFWPTAGAAGLGAARAEHDVRAGAWFFRAHFFQDPVQPGSLGIESLIQLTRWTLVALGLADGLAKPRFAPVAPGERMTWRYRGQVLPTNTSVTTAVEVTRVETGMGGEALLVCDGSLWVDAMHIYDVHGISVRVRDAASDSISSGRAN